jgi:glycogen operon protein
VEGPTSDEAVTALRARAQRNLLATLFLSQGTPLLLHGDEIGRTQAGNNNAYNQDNETSWVDWDSADADLQAFVEKLASLRRTNPVLTRATWLRGRTGGATRDDDCAWVSPDGSRFSDFKWYDKSNRSIGLVLNGDHIGERNPDGSERRGETLLVLVRGESSRTAWSVPADWTDAAEKWEVLLDTANPTEPAGTRAYDLGKPIHVSERSIVVLRRVKAP